MASKDSPSENADRLIRIGHSPDPDDAFMFYGLSSGKVKLDGVFIEHLLEDIQSLNVRAMNGDLEVTAISAHAYAYVQDKYWIMASGASMGVGYGPVLISKKHKTLSELKGKTVATPGKMTTAALLFKIFTNDIENIDIPFDQIMQGVMDGRYDGGLIIHEGQITYEKEGFHKILDFGELWSSQFAKLPLPLGLDVVRKDLGGDFARTLSHGLKQSIHYGYTHQNESIPYALQYGRGLSRELGERFVKMYVNELTVDMGKPGKQALEQLFRLGADRRLIPSVDSIELY
ncbi:MAG: ABC transporter substrate-binding protein [Ignavibacteriales bacterium]|nr:ABC transporter substrate-binding protein [Ignavibacteriales bacterium]